VEEKERENERFGMKRKEINKTCMCNLEKENRERKRKRETQDSLCSLESESGCVDDGGGVW